MGSFFPMDPRFDTKVLHADATRYFTCSAVFTGLDKEWREVHHKFGTTIESVLHVNLATFRDIIEKGGSSSIK